MEVITSNNKLLKVTTCIWDINDDMPAMCPTCCVLRMSVKLSQVPYVLRTTEVHGIWMHDWILSEWRQLLG